MSSLFRSKPAEYDPEAAAAEAAPLVNRDYTLEDDFSAFRSAAEGDENERHNVTYVFTPEWPVEGKHEQLVGVLGRDKDETVDMVRRAFPVLARYPASRITFEVSDPGAGSSSSNPSAVSSTQQYPPPRLEWARVMDEAWPQFRKRPPSRIRVGIQDLPGDDKRRKTREVRRIAFTITGAIVAPIVILGLIAFVMTNYSGDDEVS